MGRLTSSLRSSLGAAAGAALILGACTADPNGTTGESDVRSFAPSFTQSRPAQGTLIVCKDGPRSDFTNSPAGQTGGRFTLAAFPDDCRTVYTGASGTVDITVEEVASSGVFVKTVLQTFVGPNQPPTTTEGTANPITVRINNDVGAILTFVNRARGNEGCTPGFWKNHSVNAPGNQSDEWVTYTAGQYFDDVFGVGPHVTLITALNTGGGGAKALGRHAVAALLNAASSVNYWYSEAEVIAIVQDAYGSGQFETAKNLLAVRNEAAAGCPLPRNGD